MFPVANAFEPHPYPFDSFAGVGCCAGLRAVAHAAALDDWPAGRYRPQLAGVDGHTVTQVGLRAVVTDYAALRGQASHRVPGAFALTFFAMCGGASAQSHKTKRHKDSLDPLHCRIDKLKL